MRVDVSLKERVLVLVDGKPQKYLGPGRWRMLVALWRKAEVKRLDTEALVADLRAEELALVPAEDLRVIALGPYERALITRRGKPARWLGAGVQQVWTVERLRDGAPAVTVEIVDVSGVETAPLRDEVKALVPASDYVEATAAEGYTVVRYVDGALDAVLGTGRYAAWTARQKVQLAVVEVRERLLQVNGQKVDDEVRVTTGDA